MYRRKQGDTEGNSNKKGGGERPRSEEKEG